MLLYIIRHGDPIYDPDSLTPKGHLQAKALAKRLALHGLDKIYVSPLNRARQTAAPTCELLGISPEVLEWTSESLAANDFFVKKGNSQGWVFHGDTTNLRNNKTVSLTMKNWYEADIFKSHPEKDFKKGYERIINESDNFLKTLGYKRNDAVYEIINPNDLKVAVFCHQGFGTTWLSHLLGIPPHLFWSSFDISHSGVTILKFDNNKSGNTVPMCISFSDLSHIYKADLPYEYNNTVKL